MGRENVCGFETAFPIFVNLGILSPLDGKFACCP